MYVYMHVCMHAQVVQFGGGARHSVAVVTRRSFKQMLTHDEPDAMLLSTSPDNFVGIPLRSGGVRAFVHTCVFKRCVRLYGVCVCLYRLQFVCACLYLFSLLICSVRHVAGVKGSVLAVCMCL